jgi:hypothetical protein
MRSLILNLLFLTFIYCDPICLNQRQRLTVYNGITLDITRCDNPYINISEVAEPQKLEKIDARENRIKRLERNGFYGAWNVIEIDLATNEIDWIDNEAFAGLSKLVTLYLNENKIKKLQPGTFHPLDNLKEIYLQKNLIEIIPNGLFRYKEKLIRIDLDDNKIKEIQPNALVNVRNLKLLKLRGNTCFDVDLNFVNEDDQEIQNKINQANTCLEWSTTKQPTRKSTVITFSPITSSIRTTRKATTRTIQIQRRTTSSRKNIIETTTKESSTTDNPTTEPSCEEKFEVCHQELTKHTKVSKEKKAGQDWKNFLLNIALTLETIAISILLIFCFFLFKKFDEFYRIIQGVD